MISDVLTAVQFPWASPYYSYADSRKLWKVYLDLLNSLFEKVNEGATVGLNSQLLNTYVEAGMNCPGFSMWMKDDIVTEVGGSPAAYGLSSLAKIWPFECLAMPAGVTDQEAHNWLELLASGARDKIDKMHGRVWTRDLIMVGFDGNGQLVLEVLAHARDCSFRDIAQAEYQTMVYLIQRGWQRWYHARGMEPEMADLRVPEKATKMDVELEQKMFAVGVYSREGLYCTVPTTSRYLANLVGDDGRPVSPGIDAILAREDAIARAASPEPLERNNSPTLSEDAIAASYSPDRTPERAETPDHVSPIQFKNPFQGPALGGSNNMGTLVFGQMTPAIAASPTPAQASASASGARVSRSSKAIPIIKPGGGAERVEGTSPKSKEKVQDPVGTPSRRVSTYRSAKGEDDIENGDAQPARISTARAGKATRSV